MGDLDIRGGAAGITAQLEDLHRVAARLDVFGDRLRDTAAWQARLSLHPQLVASLAISPVTGARAVGALGGAIGPRSLIAVSVQVEITARSVRAAVRAYELIEAATTALLHEIQHSIGFGVGLVGGALTPAALTPAALLVGGATLLAADEHALIPGVDAWLEDIAATSGLDDAATQFGRQADSLWREALFTFPFITDTVTEGAPDIIRGLSVSGGPLVRWGLIAASAGAGVSWPPRSYEEAASIVIATGLPRRPRPQTVIRDGGDLGAGAGGAGATTRRVVSLAGRHPGDPGLGARRRHQPLRPVRQPAPDGWRPHQC